MAQKPLNMKKRFMHNNYFFRQIMLRKYPLELLGKGNPQKELNEVAATCFHINEAFKKIVDPMHRTGFMDMSKLHPFYNNKKTLCIIPGDGVRPTLGGYFAAKSKWTVLSIDPIMGGIKLDNKHIDGDDVTNFVNETYNINYPNLKCLRTTSESIDYSQYDYDFVVLIHLHSHADFVNMYSMFQNVLAFTMPCCGGVRHTLTGVKHYHDLLTEGKAFCFDDAINENKNKFYVYHKVKRKRKQRQIGK